MEKLPKATVMVDVEAERLELCAMLDQLRPADWATPSLCQGWTVHDVVAHLTTNTRTSFLDFAKGMVRHRGDFDAMEAHRATALAAQFTPEDLINRIRAHAAVPPTTIGSKPLDALIDVVVHAQDIARPLGRHHPAEPKRTTSALEHVLSSRWYGANKRLGHASLHATDTEWTGGDGEAPIQGAAIDLLLVATGRQAGLPGLSGAGVARLTELLR